MDEETRTCKTCCHFNEEAYFCRLHDTAMAEWDSCKAHETHEEAVTKLRSNPENIVRWDLKPFFDAIVKEVARHVPEKGYGYRQGDWLDYFIEESYNLVNAYAKNPKNSGEALDAAAMLGFAWVHQNGGFSINNQEKRK